MPLINFSGIASGIDSESLISALSDASRKTRVEPNQKKIDEATDTNDAMAELKTKATALQKIVRGFATINSGGVYKLATSSDDTIVSASATSAASNGSYEVTVTQLAKNATAVITRATGGNYTSTSDIIENDISLGVAEADRTVTVTIGTAPDNDEATAIVMTPTMTLDGFATAFNEASTKGTASVINVGTSVAPNYQIMITTNSEGTLDGAITVDVDAHVATAGNPTTSAFDDITISDAENAEFTLNNISGTITRFSNTVADLIPGITFNFNSLGTATINIGNDIDTTSSKIQEFVDAYNEIVTFLKENNLVERQENGKDVENIFGPLAKTRTDDNFLLSVRNDISRSTVFDPDNPNSHLVTVMADLGLKTERDGTIEFDTDDLKEALGKDAESSTAILRKFGDFAGVTNGTIDQYIRFNGLFDITTQSNQELISGLNERISRAEDLISQQEVQLRGKFSRLEGLIGRLQSQQQNLLGILNNL